jgi:OOP family OmpA-OmpF porin
MNRALFLRAEAERYRVDDAVGNRGDVNLFSVSVVVPFGPPGGSARHRHALMAVPVAVHATAAGRQPVNVGGSPEVESLMSSA